MDSLHLFFPVRLFCTQRNVFKIHPCCWWMPEVPFFSVSISVPSKGCATVCLPTAIPVSQEADLTKVPSPGGGRASSTEHPLGTTLGQTSPWPLTTFPGDSSLCYPPWLPLQRMWRNISLFGDFLSPCLAEELL